MRLLASFRLFPCQAEVSVSHTTLIVRLVQLLGPSLRTSSWLNLSAANMFHFAPFVSRTFSFVIESSQVSFWHETCHNCSSVNDVQTGSLDLVPTRGSSSGEDNRVHFAHNEGIVDLVFPAGRSEMSLRITSFDLDRIIVVLTVLELVLEMPIASIFCLSSAGRDFHLSPAFLITSVI